MKQPEQIRRVPILPTGGASAKPTNGLSVRVSRHQPIAAPIVRSGLPRSFGWLRRGDIEDERRAGGRIEVWELPNGELVDKPAGFGKCAMHRVDAFPGPGDNSGAR